ncbi:MAG: YafY family transcriptional regulator [Bryobacterales bacterium]|nr:YafY family transcriptional regulator [Bryobacterales bacterium]
MRADRLLSILLLLQSRRRMTARELAERLEVSERTILRDMDALSGSRIPVVAERGKGGGWSLLDDYQTKLTGLSPAEIQSLFLARPTRLMSDLGLKRESEAALLKLQASLPAGAREQAELARHRILVDPRGWRDPAESIASLPVLLGRNLARQTSPICLCSRSLRARRADGSSARLGCKGSTWYLVAKVEGETRTYRVSRIRQAAALDRPAAYEPDFDLAAHWEHSAAEFREKLPRYYATFLANASVMRWVAMAGGALRKRRSKETASG